MWEIYSFTYKTASGIKKRGNITALSVRDARKTIQAQIRIDNNELFDCTLGRVWLPKPPTEKQKLAQKYGFIMGSVKSAQIGVKLIPLNNKTEKQDRAINLVHSQFAKLQRDIADLFKLAGLKIK